MIRVAPADVDLARADRVAARRRRRGPRRSRDRRRSRRGVSRRQDRSPQHLRGPARACPPVHPGGCGEGAARMRGSVLARNMPKAETDVGYANARLRGMKANLLKAAFLDELIEAPDVQHAVQVLQGTALRARHRGARSSTAAPRPMVDEALKDNIVRTFGKVFDFLDPRGARHPDRAAGQVGRLQHQDHAPGRAEQRGARAGQGEPAARWVSSPRPSSRRSRASTTSMRSSPRWRRGGPYANPLREGYSEYATTGDLSDLELALDRYWATCAAKRLDRRSSNYQVAKRILATQVDVLNLVMVFRLLRADAEAVAPSATSSRAARVHRREAVPGTRRSCRTSTRCSTASRRPRTARRSTRGTALSGARIHLGVRAGAGDDAHAAGAADRRPRSRRASASRSRTCTPS